MSARASATRCCWPPITARQPRAYSAYRKLQRLWPRRWRSGLATPFIFRAKATLSMTERSGTGHRTETSSPCCGRQGQIGDVFRPDNASRRSPIHGRQSCGVWMSCHSRTDPAGNNSCPPGSEVDRNQTAVCCVSLVSWTSIERRRSRHSHQLAWLIQAGLLCASSGLSKGMQQICQKGGNPARPF